MRDDVETPFNHPLSRGPVSRGSGTRSSSDVVILSRSASAHRSSGVLAVWMICAVSGAMFVAGTLAGSVLAGVVLAAFVGLCGSALLRGARVARRDANSASRSMVASPASFVLVASTLSVASITIAVILLAGLTLLATQMGRNSARHRAETSVALALCVLAPLGILWISDPLGTRLTLAVLASGLIVACVALVARSIGRRQALIHFVDGVSIYLVLSVILFLAGVRSRFESQRVGGLENSFGLSIDRVHFPLAPGIDTAPAIAGAFIAGLPSIVCLVGPGRRILAVVAALCGGFIIVAANYRSPLILAVLVGLLLSIAPRKFCIIAAPLAIGAFVLSLEYSAMSSSIDEFSLLVEDAVPGLGRSDSETPLNRREFIWQESISTYRSAPLYRQLVGYGPAGHVASGAEARYRAIFRDFYRDAADAHPSPHSSVLQTLFDTGAVGALLMTGGLTVAMVRAGRLGRRGDLTGQAALAVMTVCVAAGATAVVMSPTGALQEPLTVFAGLAVLCPARQKAAVATGRPTNDPSALALTGVV